MADEELYRILYYDCAPFVGTAVLPVSAQKKTFVGSDSWLHELARRDLFAVRRGILKFRGCVLKHIPSAEPSSTGFRLSAIFRAKGCGYENRSRHGDLFFKSRCRSHCRGHQRHGLYSSDEARAKVWNTDRPCRGTKLQAHFRDTCSCRLPPKDSLAHPVKICPMLKWTHCPGPGCIDNLAVSL